MKARAAATPPNAIAGSSAAPTPIAMGRASSSMMAAAAQLDNLREQSNNRLLFGQHLTLCQHAAAGCRARLLYECKEVGSAAAVCCHPYQLSRMLHSFPVNWCSRTWWPAHVHQPCGQRLSDHHVVGWRAAHVVHSNAVAGVAADGHAEACRRFGDGDVREQSRLRQQQMTSSNQEVNITMCKTVPGKDSTLRCEFKLRCCVLSSLHYGAAKQQK